jgi:hypothetical protein
MGVIKKTESLNPVHTLTEINAQPAFITTMSGQPVSATILDIRGGLIQNLFIVVNPDKLKDLVSHPG